MIRDFTGPANVMMWMCCRVCGLSHSMRLALVKRLYARIMHLLPLLLQSNDKEIKAMVLEKLVSLASILIRQFGKEKKDRVFFVDMVCTVLTYATVLLCNMPPFDTIPIQRCINSVLAQYDATYMTQVVHDKLTSLRLYAIMHSIQDTPLPP
jgi:hypothetical protein